MVSTFFVENVFLMIAKFCCVISKENHRANSFIIDFQQMYNVELDGFLKFFSRNIELGSLHTKDIISIDYKLKMAR